ncbi:MAG: hypothetical protein IJ751_10315 [Oscillospiraceae bacterium]|nr:hypothetical protein [Oscillospiraceae bacterium]
MPDPLSQVRRAAANALTQAARGTGREVIVPPEQLRLRPDGKGGELASPLPQQLGLESGALIAHLPPHPLWEAAFPSGGWIGFTLSSQWQALVRAYAPPAAPLALCPPPMPAFPSRILPAHWAYCALLGMAQPQTAARLDRGNPAVLLEQARRLAQRNRGENRPDRVLLCQCALVQSPLSPEALAREADRLARSYLTKPGEDALTAETLAYVQARLGLA